MWDELENALAWYASAPNRWLESRKQDLTAAAEWMWTVLQGDFAEDTTTGQTMTGMAVSMIPFVDQLCDLRDLVANVQKIRQDMEDKWAWFALVLTLVGLFPGVGSLVKGCLKIVLAKVRKQIYKAGAKSLESDTWKALKPAVETGIQKLNQHLDKPVVRKNLAALKIDNPYKYLAGKVRDLAAKVSVGQLLKALDGCISGLNDMAGLMRQWGAKGMETKVGKLLGDIAEVRKAAAEKMRSIVQPAVHFLNCLARRFEIEADMSYRAYANVVNPHAFKRPTLNEEIEAMREELPSYAGKNVKKKYDGLESVPAKDG